ncbi:MAG: DEAD/DEAH box helicase family protein [Bacillota bacterium]|nr:DEAD/DEAH box helicase family protein [Bacillota bacterium]
MEDTFDLKEYERLKKENAYLKNLLSNMMHQGENNPFQINEDNIITNKSTPQDKINLFKSLFKGRIDAYSIRWESKNGKSGYTPACELEWQKPICRKPEIKCSDCQHRKLLSLTDQVLFDHLSGEKTVGIYPLLQDETCWFLALDFDKQDWQEDVLTFLQVCKAAGVPSYLERSRSGNGAHVWIFFSEKIRSTTARNLGLLLLKRTIEKRHEIGMDSFDRMFPNQDTLPKGGFGNLIALPLQLLSKNHGNSVFVDENFIPFQDQWMYLSSIKKMTKQDIKSTLQNLKDGQLKEPSQSQLIPSYIKIVLKNGLHLSKEELPSFLIAKIFEMASFKNPEFYKAQAKRMSTYGIQRVIACYEENSECIILPRGLLENVSLLLKEHSVEVELIDEQYYGETIEVSFHGKLTSQQEEALTQLTNHSNGVLAATTGFGKTVTAAALIAKKQINTLVIVDRTTLLQQWTESLANFLNLNTNDIGQLGGGKKKLTGKIDVATIQSLNFKGELKSHITQYGQIIVDECHHISAFTFEKVLKQVRAKNIYGLTATPVRKDGLHPIIFLQCGPIRFKSDAKKQSKIRPFKHSLLARSTNFMTKNSSIQEIYSEIAEDEHRNQLMFNDVLLELEKSRSPIILTERIDHIEKLAVQFNGFAKNIIILAGNKSRSERKKELEKLAKIPDSQERLIIATGKYIGEGFDDARLDTLFLAMPISWKGTLQQYVGRLHRLHSNKNEVKVFDYVDHHVPILKTMYEKRLAGYKSMGYVIANNTDTSQTEQMKLF